MTDFYRKELTMQSKCILHDLINQIDSVMKSLICTKLLKSQYMQYDAFYKLFHKCATP